MQPALVLGLTWLVAAFADDLPIDRPIPQDVAKLEARRRERLEWNRRTVVQPYDKPGKKDPRWDVPARRALGLASAMNGQQVDPLISPAEVYKAASEAVAAGCDDPMVLYVLARTSAVDDDLTPAERGRRVRASADALEHSAYPAVRRAVALIVAAGLDASVKEPTAETRAAAARRADAALDLFAASAAEDPRGEDWDDEWHILSLELIAIRRRLGDDGQAALDRVDARLTKVAGVEALRGTVKGKFLTGWAWEARTSKIAAAVAEDQFRTFAARLTQARDALNAAWKAKPGDPRAAEFMLNVEKGLGDGDREAMETWFDRALKANGDNKDACWVKLDWLDPKWHGTDEEMLAFGRACAATKNWRAGITLLAADAHLRHWERLAVAEKQTYFRPDAIFDPIEAIFEEYLKQYPEDEIERSRYAALCCLGGRPSLAHAQFERLGDRLCTWVGPPGLSLDRLKKLREQTARYLANEASGKAK